MTRIAIDGMGGDSAPQVIVDGVVQAANLFDYEMMLVGDETRLKRELNNYKVTGGRIFVHHASEVVSMGESPVQAVKRKKDSSVNVCTELLKRKEVDAVVTAGNTGAAVASSMLNLGLLPGIKRPGIAIAYPSAHGISLAIDVGANVDPTAEHLLHYAIMAEIYSRFVLKKRNPSIGLLNIGEEEGKGTEVTKEAHKLLRESNLNFVGNVEGRDFFTGKCDCIVTDGFVGNVVLKIIEGVVDVVGTLFKREIDKNPIAKFGALLCKPALDAIQRDTNYEEAGGAPLLGINGVVIISHGGSTAMAIRNAIRLAATSAELKVNDQIVNEIQQREKEPKN
ncbi:MAG: phosphate acyltransferase PlsX [Candidatus Omnitrophica bacterium]|nr:phosphate acyltransferase PlsX [Candidatus Omnitrophota bacterium]